VKFKNSTRREGKRRDLLQESFKRGNTDLEVLRDSSHVPRAGKGRKEKETKRALNKTHVKGKKGERKEKHSFKQAP